MLFLLALLNQAASKQACPAGIKEIYNTADEVTIGDDGHFHFYTHHIMPQDKLTLRVYAANPVEVRIGTGLMCASDDDKVFLNVEQANKLFEKTLDVNNEIGATIVSVKGSPNTKLVISVEGRNPNNADSGTWTTFSTVFLLLVITLLVMMFVHSILARGKVHYQVEVQD